MNSPEHDLAGAYVLGTLSSAALRAVEARLPHEPALRNAVVAWEARLLPLAALVAPVEPSPQLWMRIARDTGPAPSAARPRPFDLRGWWHSLALWRGLAAAGCAAAVVLASLLVLRTSGTAPHYVVVLVAPQDQAPGWVVQASAAGDAVDLIPLGLTPVPAEKSLQFWTKGDGWQGPVSLGLVQPGRRLHVPLSALPPLRPNQLFELTLEPAQGSPLGRPTGPIQFIGRAVEML